MIFWLAACHPSDPPGGSTFEGLATAAGYRVQRGTFGRFELDDCCTSGGTCPMNNPDSPFLAYAVPPAPDQVAVDPYPDEAGRSPVFHLRADEALVFTGTTPPEAEYYSFRSYLYGRAGETDPMLASLGPSLNNALVPEPSAPLAIVTSMDATVEQQVVDWLVEIGWDPDQIHADRIPAPLVRTGLDEESDTFAVLARAGGFANPFPGQGWIDDPGATVLRLTPSGPEAEPVERFNLEPLPPRGTGTTEADWVPALDALTAAIVAAYPDRLALPATSQELDQPTYDCVAVGDCRFDNHDRYYAQLPTNKIGDDGAFVVVLGINHQRTGKASYETIAVNDVETLGGVAAVDGDALVGSARAWLPAEPRADDLYALVIARDCSDFAGPCVEIPTTCPGVDPASDMAIDFRVWLEPATGAAPLGSELAVERALLFSPAI